MKVQKEAAAIVARLEEEYERSVAALRTHLKAFLEEGVRPDPALRETGAYVYPQLSLHWSGESGYPSITRAYARMSRPGRLFDHHHPARPVPPLSAGTADPAGSRTMARRSRSARRSRKFPSPM